MNLRPDRWERIEEIYHAVLARPAEARAVFVREACGDDVSLRMEVESLLAQDASAASFLETPAAGRSLMGRRLGPYQVTGLLGAGGMGEVYRASDTTLNRDVALKILPEALAPDPDRLARLKREARVLASLNHPNIAAIYGFEDSGSTHALVLELVEGPTLADRIAKRAIPLDEALPIAKQIAEALEAAHEQGIIHRDLKPANVKVRDDGTVKVLDFGLAKAVESTSPERATISPTVSGQRTPPGIILGTAAYMSPEQAAAKPVDNRTDLWAFGVVLLEMLTGRQVFAGETTSHVLAAILSKEPDWTALPARTPAAIRRLLRRCLEKDRKRRLDSASDARLEIEDALAEPAREFPSNPAPGGALRYLIPTTIVPALAVALVALIAMRAFTRAPSPEPSRFRIVPPSSQPLIIQGSDRDIAITPDGRHIVYHVAPNGGSGPRGLAVRSLDQLDAKIVGGVAAARAPFVSPDGKWIGFFDFMAGSLKKVSILGGPPVTLCHSPDEPRGASWGPDDTIIFATSDPSTGLLRMSAEGGDPTVLTTPDTAAGESDHVNPFVLPGGHAVLFTILRRSVQIDDAQIGVLDLQTGRKKILIRGVDARYVDSGHLVYALGGTLRAVGFDLERLEVTGTPVQVPEAVTVGMNGTANFVLAGNGTLVYVPSRGSGLRQLVWVDRNGREKPIGAPARAFDEPRISPDGTRVAVSVVDQENDIWVWDLTRETLTRLTIDPAKDTSPVWTPDGRRVVFSSNRSGVMNLYWQVADNTGTAERLTTSSNQQMASSVSPDGSRLTFAEVRPKTGWDVMMLGLGPTLSATFTRPTQPIIQTSVADIDSRVSPNGHWISYQSSESGMTEIHVRPFPNVDAGHWQVTTNGGTRAVWARNGRELFYQANGALMAVPVRTTDSIFSAGNAIRLFDVAPYYFASVSQTFDVSADGQKFLMIKNPAASEQDAAPSLIVAEHWTEELRRLMPAPR
jgi:serine/threonine-protein kinase